jgi:hypothetical protein
MSAHNAIKGSKNHSGEATKNVGVGIWNLHVMITNDDGSWFAQAFEIDYAAQGSTLDDVKARFETGLYATIDEHLKVFGGLKQLVQPAPPEVWQELLETCNEEHQFEYSQISVHKLPFKNIEYRLPKAA